MKTRIICIIIAVAMLISGVASAATYTLPEKMQNQLAIGSGLKGTITVLADGELAGDPFLKAVSDATYDLRGMASGHDLHYYLFQESSGSQAKLAEMYRKDGKYYFRSDAVPDKTLELTGFSVFLDSLFPGKGENPSLSSALLNYMALPEDTKEKQWKPVFTRYQNALEMWLHDFTAQAEVIKQENGGSAFDFSYVIPVEEMKKKLVSLLSDFAGDAEFLALLDTVMTKELRELYFNTALTFFYEQAVGALNLKDDIRLSKRVSALGDLIHSKMILPLDPAITGYDTITIDSADGCSVYTLSGTDKALVLGLPDLDLLNEKEYEKSIWVSRIDNADPDLKDKNFSVRADVKKEFSEYNDEEDRSHREEHYTVSIRQDTSRLPEALADSDLADWHDMEAELHLHYHSKYSQNSATTLEIRTGFKQNGSSLSVEATIKTAAPWLFMPFEITNPTEIGPEHPDTFKTYQEDWISNVESMIHHTEEGPAEATDAPAATAQPAEDAGSEAEQDASDTAEAAPLPEEEESGEGAE